MYLYTCIYSQKLSTKISCGFKIVVKLGVGMQKFKNNLGVGFSKIILKVDLQISPSLRGQFTKKTQFLICFGSIHIYRYFFVKEISCKFYREFFCKFYRDFFNRIEGDFNFKGISF